MVKAPVASDEVIQLLVLGEIRDDYENVDLTILQRVAVEGIAFGLTIERADVIEALTRLIERGLAKAYHLSSRKPFATEIDGMPALEVVEENFCTYFLATLRGRELQRGGH
jgi:hypothetical protein